VLATLTLALAFLGVTGQRLGSRLRARASKHREIASDYLIVAERAKAYRMVHAERIARVVELDACIADLRKLKESRDAEFHASTDEVEQARSRTRIEPAPRIEIDLDDDEVEGYLEPEPKAMKHPRR